MSKPRYRPQQPPPPKGPRRWLLVLIVILVSVGLIVSMIPNGTLY